VGTTSTAQPVTLTNTGSATLTLTAISVTGTDSGDFAETNTCGSSVNASASCTISVTFTPMATGTRTASVSISDNASGSPQSLPLAGTGASSTSTGNTPLVDFTDDQRYLGTYPGLLYTDPVNGVDSNMVPAQHDADGKSIAATVVPLDANGNPSSSGKIGVVGIGMSNWTDELCRADPDGSPCSPGSFLEQASSNSRVNHTTLALVDCAQGAHVAVWWIDDSMQSYTQCIQDRLPLLGITARQVEVVLYKDADREPSVSLTSSTVCRPQALPIPSSNADVCTYEQYMGMMARFLKTVFPNVKQLFVHSRTYGGYATINLNPEPFAYEYGFATKWFVSAQIAQVAGGAVVDQVAGDLNYANGTAPWIAWGPYWWAAGTTPCNNCQIPGQIWVRSDFQTDGTHPSPSGVTKVGNNLMSFYLSSPYSPWFRAP
jgi:hypothetical protein